MKTDTKLTKPEQAVSDRADSNHPNPQNQTADETQEYVETGGPKGLEPTRFGDWEKNGRCSDF
jgi:hypothetical protein